MDDLFVVQIVQGVGDLKHVLERKRERERSAGDGVQRSSSSYGSSLAIVKAASSLQLLVQLALGGKLEDEIDARLVVEPAVHAENVGMLEMALNLQLSPELMFHAGLLQLRLEQDLLAGQRKNSLLRSRLDTWGSRLCKSNLDGHDGLVNAALLPG